MVVNYLHDADGAQSTKQGVEAEGRRAIVVQADIGHKEDVARLFTDSLEAFGRIDILMNNASVDASGMYVADLDIDDFAAALRTNLFGPVMCSGHYIRHRKQVAEPGGRIINVTSVHEEIPRAGAADYNCSKGRCAT